MSINSIGSNLPIQVSFGGLGVGTETQFGVLYGNGSSPVGATSAGTAGNVLTSNGGVSAPTFQPIGSLPGAGAWNFIQTQTASTSASLNFTTGLTSYPTLIFIITNLLGDTPNTFCRMLTSTNSGSTWSGIISGYSAWIFGTAGTGNWNQNSTSSSAVPLSTTTMPTTGIGLSGTYYIYGNGYANASQGLRGEFGVGVDTNSNSPFGVSFGANQFGTSQTLNGYQIIMSSGNIVSGTVTLYGLAI